MTDSTYRSSNPESVAALLAEGGVLIDVREDDEWAAGHAPAAAHHRLGDLQAAAVPAGTVLTICRSGKRSAKAAELLAASGREVINVEGGMAAWERAGLPVVTDGGQPGAVL